jgi:hypothetical protein
MNLKALLCVFLAFSVAAAASAEEAQAEPAQEAKPRVKKPAIIGESRFRVGERVGRLVDAGTDRIERSFEVHDIRPDIAHPWKALEYISIVSDRGYRVCQIHMRPVAPAMAREIMEVEAEGWKQLSETEGRRLYRAEKPAMYAVYAPGGELIIWNETRHAQFLAVRDPFGDPFSPRAPWQTGFSSYGQQ